MFADAHTTSFGHHLALTLANLLPFTCSADYTSSLPRRTEVHPLRSRRHRASRGDHHPWHRGADVVLHLALIQDQIEAGKEIRLRLAYWQQADSALRRMSEALPGFDAEATLLKVAAINTLYGTNLYAFARMANHITKTLKSDPPRRPALVERLACVPGVEGQRVWRHWSFASKFCHFFINPEEFPIYDTWAHQTVQRHLGRDRHLDQNRPYTSFVKNLNRLIEEAALTATPASLDSYLWIRGGFERWRREPEGPMNGELKAFFQKNDRGRLMKRLLNDGT